MSQRITIDPVTRIEGHLRIDCEIENGVVSKAWASGTMWRGMEELVCRVARLPPADVPLIEPGLQRRSVDGMH